MFHGRKGTGFGPVRVVVGFNPQEEPWTSQPTPIVFMSPNLGSSTELPSGAHRVHPRCRGGGHEHLTGTQDWLALEVL